MSERQSKAVEAAVVENDSMIIKRVGCNEVIELQAIDKKNRLQAVKRRSDNDE
ncbi:hypothetical protein [Paenibacillus dendritiformis]|uniref:hypothetical protein n=1 Tax=Paenibacillus dendritiformis TaxID=130049 RepID=UPI00387E20CE